MARRRTMTTCWTKDTPFCVSQTSNTGLACRSSRLACQMNWLLGSGNYTFSRIWNGMTFMNALMNTGIEASSEAWDSWCCSQRTLNNKFTTLSDASTAMHHRDASIPECTPRTCGEEHRSGAILQDNDMLIDVYSTLRVGHTLGPFIFRSDGKHLSNFAGDKNEWPGYITFRNLSSKICKMTSTHCIWMVALLPIPISNCNLPEKRLDDQWQTNQDVLIAVLRLVLQFSPFNTIPSLGASLTTSSAQLATSGIATRF